MNFIELATERYSLRSFDTRKVEQEKLDLILKAGQLAPTAVNYQPQRILVIESDDELGLGTTWVGYFDPIAVSNSFNVPANLEQVCIFPIGYPNKDAKPHPNHTKRKDILETVSYNHF